MGWNGAGETKPIQNDVGKSKSRSVTCIVAAGCAMAMLAVGLMVVFSSGEDPDSPSTPVQWKSGDKGRLTHAASRIASRSPKDAVRQAMPKNLPKSKRTGRPVRVSEMFEHLTGADRALAEAVQSALDAEDFDKVVKAATESLASDNPEVRLNAVEALGWFGVQALPELTGAMADADEDVRQSAESQFELAVQELENSRDQFNVAMAAFGTLSDTDQLMSLGGIISNAATELIDGEDDLEKAAKNRLNVLQSLVDIIDGDAVQNVEAAKDLYNDITGYEWQGIDEAQRYLDDPDNYDPDDMAKATEVAPLDDACI